MKSFMQGIASPFTACWQPTFTSCVSGGPCGAPEYPSAFRKKPAMVSPTAYRDSRSSPPFEEESSVVLSNKVTPSRRNDAASPTASLPATDIEQPHINDVLSGRGGSSNRHAGNIHFRELVAANKKLYVGLTKKQKMMVARNIVDAVRNADPPGRFLAKDPDTGLFYDVGIPRSLEKTSQALREKNSNDSPEEGDGEGIETSVEAYHSVVGESNAAGGAGVGEESAEASTTANTTTSTTTTKKSSKKAVEAPPLIIPPHLKSIYGPKKEHDYTMSPNEPHYMDNPYSKHPPPYHHSPYNNMHGPPPHHNHHGYPPGHPQHRPYVGNPHSRHPYPPSPPASGYSEHGQYYYHRHHPPHTPPYGRYPYNEQQDHRESYSEYYSRSAERDSPNRPDTQGRPPAPQYPHTGYPAHPLAASGHPGRHVPPGPQRPIHGAPLSPPSYRPSYYGYSQQRYPPPFPPPPTQRDDSSSNFIYRTPSNGYVRGNTDISPERQREIKRQRNVDGHIRRVSEASLSSAVRNSLSLEDRTVGRERQHSAASDIASNVTEPTTNTDHRHAAALMSPSSILQSRSRRSMDGKDKSRDPFEEKKDEYSALSGLAALSTAAFLKLDEDE
jgi:hypothetical protein